MKIVDYDTFIKMPAGTLYAEYTPCVFGDTRIKHDILNGGKDWFYSDLTTNPEYNGNWEDVCESMEKGEDVPRETDCCQRDGMFDYDRKFLVYSGHDVETMIETLKETLK